MKADLSAASVHYANLNSAKLRGPISWEPTFIGRISIWLISARPISQVLILERLR